MRCKTYFFLKYVSKNMVNNALQVDKTALRLAWVFYYHLYTRKVFKAIKYLK